MQLDLSFKTTSDTILINSNNENSEFWQRFKKDYRENIGFPVLEDSDLNVELKFETFFNLLRYSPQTSSLLNIDTNFQNLLENTNRNYDFVNNHLPISNRLFTREKILDEIQNLNLSSGIKLKPYQIENLDIQLNTLNSGNFSVPGSGKTLTALCLHYLYKALNKINDLALIVVAPNSNVIDSWFDDHENFFGEGSSSNFSKLNELDFKNESLYEYLNSNKFISTGFITYHKLLNRDTVLSLKKFMFENKTHLILDESHKIKSALTIDDEQGKIGKAALEIVTYAHRRDILSGTPITKSLKDIESQYEFLFRHSPIRDVFNEINSVKKYIKGSWTRTTKSMMDLPPVLEEIVEVPMTENEKKFYALNISEIARDIVGLDPRINSHKDEIEKKIMKLLVSVTIPVETAEGLLATNSQNQSINKVTMEVLKGIINEGPASSKIKKAITITNDLIEKNEKVIVWTNWRRANIEFINSLESGLAKQLVGGMTNEERRGVVEEFKKGELNVLVANPSVAGEGISLHDVCKNAIYINRSFNAIEYLQSRDRIHRIGIKESPKIYLLQSIAPKGPFDIESHLSDNLNRKIQLMYKLFEDPELKELQLLEDEIKTYIKDTKIRIPENDFSNVLEKLKEII
jgi:superfamily II DNA or RNA helicase